MRLSLVLAILFAFPSPAKAHAAPLVVPAWADLATLQSIESGTDDPAALALAVHIHRSNLDDAAAIQSTNAFFDRFSKDRDKGAVAARAFLTLVLEEEAWRQPGDFEELLRRFVGEFSAVADARSLIRARVMLGIVLWNKSCPIAGDDGACIERKDGRRWVADRIAEERAAADRAHEKWRERSSRYRCANRNFVYVVHSRNKAVAAEAQSLFSEALRGARSMSNPDENTRHAIGEARFYRAEPNFEAALSDTLPEGLDFTPPDPYSPAAQQRRDKARLSRSIRLFTSWLNRRVRDPETRPSRPSRHDELPSIFGRDPVDHGPAYGPLLPEGTPAGAASRARAGALFLDLVDQLEIAPVPRSPRPPEGMSEEEFDRAFDGSYDGCGGGIDDRSEPIRRHAMELLLACARDPVGLSLTDSRLGLCIDGPSALSPAEHPPDREITPMATWFALAAEAAPLVRELPSP